MMRIFIYKVMLLLAASLFAVCSSILIYARWFEKPWLVYQNLPFPPVILKVHPGDVVPLVIERCNSTKVIKQYSITHSLLNTDSKNLGLLPVLLPSLPLSLEPGCNRYITKVHIVPIDTAPGTYKFFGSASVQGLLVTHDVEWYSEEFEVVDQKVKP
jgi:hypothetical protein